MQYQPRHFLLNSLRRRVRRAAEAARRLTRGAAEGRSAPWCAALLSLCALMSLGFIAIRPGDSVPGYYTRASLSAPGIPDSAAGTSPASPPVTPPDKPLFYDADSLPTPPYFKDNKDKEENWLSSGGLLGLRQGAVVLRGALGEQALDGLGLPAERGGSSPIPLEEMEDIADGRRSAEALLAALSSGLQAPRPPEEGWLRAAEEPAPLCRADRMGTASWLNLLRLGSLRAQTGRRPARYLGYVEHFSRRYALPPSLIYAIMHTESGFNPLAVSAAKAMGLMQIVPHTAGVEVHAYLTGERARPEDEALLNPEDNIHYGAAYLHLLKARHFNKVKNPVSRELCVIAAYNCGPAHLLRTFGPNRAAALEEINSLTPEQLYEQLVSRLPSRETRQYLPKVLSARNDFLRGAVRF